MSLKVAVRPFKWGIDQAFMLTQPTTTLIFSNYLGVCKPNASSVHYRQKWNTTFALYEVKWVRDIHVSLTFLIWLKMTLKCVVHMKRRRFNNQKDPPFNMKHQLMSADPLFLLSKLTWSRKANFYNLFICVYRLEDLFLKAYFLFVLD